jgi:apolipoprotein N-acyltransferase
MSKAGRRRARAEAAAPRPRIDPRGIFLGARRPAACVASGALMFLSCANFDVWPLAWIALVPTLFAIRGVSPRRALLLGWLTGLTANWGGFYWLYGLLAGRFGNLPPAAAGPIFLLLVGYQGFLLALWAYGVRRLTPTIPTIVAAPVLMVALELCYWMIFPWYFAITQAWVTPVIQVAELGGPVAVTFLLVLVNAVVFELMVTRPLPRRRLAGALAVVVLALGYGALRIHQVDAARAGLPKLKVGLVQANFGNLEGDVRRLAPLELRVQREMSADLERRGAGLIVWPESALYYAYRRDQTHDFDDGRSVSHGLHTPMIIGALTYGADSHYPFNSALMIEPGGRIGGRFDKNFLLLFGEYIPFYESIPWFKKLFPAASNLARGHEVTTFAVGPYRVAPMICYEDIIPAFGRRLAALRPHLLVNLTNDAWFGRTSEPYEHLALAVFRAVEHRVDLVRSVNTGVSAFIDAAGRVTQKGPSIDPNETPDAPRTALLGEVALREPTGLYGRLGDTFGLLNVLGVLAMVIWTRRRRS